MQVVHIARGSEVAVPTIRGNEIHGAGLADRQCGVGRAVDAVTSHGNNRSVRQRARLSGIDPTCTAGPEITVDVVHPHASVVLRPPGHRIGRVFAREYSVEHRRVLCRRPVGDVFASVRIRTAQT